MLALRRGKGMVLDPGRSRLGERGLVLREPDADGRGARCARPARGGRREARRPRRGSTPAPDRYKVAAAWLVERAGFRKGYGDGRVGVSRKHALALVNRGQGTTRELLALAHEIRAGVARAFGVVLSAEPVLVGCALD